MSALNARGSYDVTSVTDNFVFLEDPGVYLRPSV